MYLLTAPLSQATLGEWEDAFIRSPHSSDHQSLWLLHHSHYIWWYHTGPNYRKWKWECESEKLKLYLNGDAVLSSCQVRKGLKQGMDLTQTMWTTTSLVLQPTCCWKCSFPQKVGWGTRLCGPLSALLNSRLHIYIHCSLCCALCYAAASKGFFINEKKEINRKRVFAVQVFHQR